MKRRHFLVTNILYHLFRSTVPAPTLSDAHSTTDAPTDISISRFPIFPTILTFAYASAHICDQAPTFFSVLPTQDH